MSRSESEVKVTTSTMNNEYSFNINFKQDLIAEFFSNDFLNYYILYSLSEQIHREFKYFMFNKQNKSYFKLQICDVISRWEKSYQDFHSGKLDSNKTIRFLYKNRLVFCNWVVLFSNWVRIHLHIHVYWYILFLSPMIMCITLRRPF